MKSREQSFERLAREMANPRRSAGDPDPTPVKAISTPAGSKPEASSSPSNPRETVPKTETPDDQTERERRDHAKEADRARSQEAGTKQLDMQGVHSRLVCLLEPRSEHTESYYRLRHVLETRRQAGSALVVGITSPTQKDGKTLTGINLAGALAKDSSSRVLLLDLDLRSQGDGVSEYLGMSASRDLGVVDWIRNSKGDDDTPAHYLRPFNLHVVTAGSNPELPYELLKSARLDELLARARNDYDFVIIDTPQILRLPDTELISRLVDGFLVVVRADETRQANLEEALNLMTEKKVFGLVFNAMTESR